MNRLTQVLHNIMENAIKFAPEGGRLRVSNEVHGDSVWVSINNSGDAIPEEDIPYILTASTRSTNPIRGKRRGTGIGLSIVKKYPQGTRPEDMGNVERAGRNDLHVYAQKSGLILPIA